MSVSPTNSTELMLSNNVTRFRNDNRLSMELSFRQNTNNTEIWMPPAIVFDPDQLTEYISQNSRAVDIADDEYGNITVCDDLEEFQEEVEDEDDPEYQAKLYHRLSIRGSIRRQTKDHRLFQTILSNNKLMGSDNFTSTENNGNNKDNNDNNDNIATVGGARVLGQEVFLECHELWSLSKVFQWVSKLPEKLQLTLLDEYMIRDCLKGLIKFHYGYMDEDVIFDIVTLIIDEFKQNDCFMEAFDDQYYIDNEASISGVIPQLSTCYSTHYNHLQVKVPYSCYDVFCQFCERHAHENDIKERNPYPVKCSWHNYWNINPQEASSLKDKDLCQFMIFEIITTANRNYFNAKAFIELVGGKFKAEKDDLASPMSKNEFFESAFGGLQKIVEIKQKYLIEPLRKVLSNQGRYITKDFWKILLQWLQHSEELYMRDWKHKCRLAIFLDFAKDRSSQALSGADTSAISKSRIYKWVGKQKSEYSGKFSMYFDCLLFDLVELKNIFDRLTIFLDRHNTPQSEALMGMRVVSDTIKRLLLQLDQYKATIDTEEYIEKLDFRTHNIIPCRLDKSMVFESQIRSHTIENTNLFILLFNSTVLFCIRDLKKNKYTVIANPIPSYYIYAKEDSQIANYGFRGRKTSGSTIKVKSVGDSTRFFFHDYQGSVINAINEHREKFSKSLFDHKVFKLKQIFINENFDHQNMGKNDDQIYGSDVLQFFPKRRSHTKENPLLIDTIICSLTITFQGRRYYVVGKKSGVSMCKMGTKKWVKVLNVSGLVYIGVMILSETLLVLSKKELVCVKLSDLCEVMEHKPRFSLNGVPAVKVLNKWYGDIVGISILHTKHTTASTPNESLACFICTSSCVRLQLYQVSNDRSVTVLPKKNYKIKGVLMNSYVNCSSLENNVFFPVAEKGFATCAVPEDEVSTIEIKYFPSSDNLLAAVDRRSSTLVDTGLLESARKLSTSRPIGIFKLSSEETLVAFSRVALFCNSRGSLSRDKFLEFGTYGRASWYQNGYLLVLGVNCIEVYCVNVNDKKLSPGSLVQVIKGKGFRPVDFAACKIVSQAFDKDIDRAFLEVLYVGRDS
ncbi:hypothetical protein DASC09_039100 [Saccharomycopsis crataegensis]|uniref:CNH domain-containing protein n=1 Tax=Saccharomycopsis crataegensis TaxID=43959 RepID=A0AAV5QPX0_9ASCO|nr:hypothetical protein DASC09_039100 [Saccharomycopsis crataegensis]